MRSRRCLLRFLFGIALGSMVFARWVDRIKQPIAVFGIVQLGIGLFALILMPAFEELYGMSRKRSNPRSAEVDSGRSFPVSL